MSRIAASTYCGSSIVLIAGRTPPAGGPNGIQVRPVCPIGRLRCFAANPCEAKNAAESVRLKTRRFITRLSLTIEAQLRIQIVPYSWVPRRFLDELSSFGRPPLAPVLFQKINVPRFVEVTTSGAPSLLR